MIWYRLYRQSTDGRPFIDRLRNDLRPRAVQQDVVRGYRRAQPLYHRRREVVFERTCEEMLGVIRSSFQNAVMCDIGRAGVTRRFEHAQLLYHIVRILRLRAEADGNLCVGRFERNKALAAWDADPDVRIGLADPVDRLDRKTPHKCGKVDRDCPGHGVARALGGLRNFMEPLICLFGKTLGCNAVSVGV